LGHQGTAEERIRALESVGPLCDLGSGDEAGKWSMRTSGRRHLTAQAGRSQGKGALAGAPADDGVARALRYRLAVASAERARFPSRGLAVLGEGQSWAKAWVSRPVDDDELRRRIARRLLRDDFQQQLPAGFVGHEDKLSRLSAFLLAPPQPVRMP